MATFRHALILDLAGNLARRSQQFAQSFGRFASSSRREIAMLGRVAAAAGNGLDRLGNRYTALLGGAAGAGAARQVVNLQRRFTRLGVTADLAGDEVEKLKQEIFATAQAPDIRVDPSEITSAIENIVEKTGDLKFARDNILNIGRAIQASGGAGAEIGALVSEFRKFGIVTENEVLKALDTLVLQGKAGAFTIANLAGQGERLVSAYAATGRVGPQAVRELGAVIQVIRQGTGSAEQATTAFEAVLRTLQDAEKIKQLKARGIEIFEPGQPGVMRSIDKIMVDIITRTKGNAVAISQVFDAEAMRAFNAAAAEFKRTGSIQSLQTFLAIQGDGKALIADSSRVAKDAAGAMQNLSSAWQQFADRNLAEPIQAIADALNAIDPDRMQRIMRNLAIGASVVGGLIVARKAIGLASDVAGLFGRGGKGGAAAGAAGMAAAGIVNVRVVNWPMTFSRTAGFGGMPGRIPGRAGGLLGRLGGPLAILAGLADAASVATNGALSGREKAAGIAGAAGGTGGALLGMKAGAALGAFGGPLAPFTVPAGALIGGAAGYALGDRIGQVVGEAVSDAVSGDRAGSNKAEIAVRFENAPPGMRVSDMSASQGTRITADMGRVFLSP